MFFMISSTGERFKALRFYIENIMACFVFVLLNLVITMNLAAVVFLYEVRAASISERSLSLASSWSKKFCSWNVVLPINFDSGVLSNNNKIFGMATGIAYTHDKLVPFCKSIRLVGFNGTVLIGVSKLNSRSERKRSKLFNKYNITGIYLDGTKGYEWSQSICRYHAYMKFVDHFADENDSILITDVRDVFFQDDPFDSKSFGSKNFLNTNVTLLLFQEGLNDISKDLATLTNTAPNFRWMTNIYGYKSFKPLGQNPPLCSGTTIGTKSGMYYYTRAMLHQGFLCLRMNARKFDKKRGHVCSGGADQGYHNFLFWSKLLPKAIAIQNGAGPVYTIGMFRSKPVRSINFDQNYLGEVVSPPQRGPQLPVPLIHQWDRHQDLVKHVFQKLELKAEGVSALEFNAHLSMGSFTGKYSNKSRKDML